VRGLAYVLGWQAANTTDRGSGELERRRRSGHDVEGMSEALVLDV